MVRRNSHLVVHGCAHLVGQLPGEVIGAQSIYTRVSYYGVHEKYLALGVKFHVAEDLAAYLFPRMVFFSFVLLQR